MSNHKIGVFHQPVRASDDFVGYLLLRQSFFDDELHISSRRLLSHFFAEYPESVKSDIATLALGQLRQSEPSSLNALWAAQYVSEVARGPKFTIVRSQTVTNSDYALEAELVSDVGGEDNWNRLQEKTKEFLMHAERQWKLASPQIGKQKQ